MAAAVLAALAACACGQASKEFNWIPSGEIRVGESESEAASFYQADAPEVVRQDLAYASGRKVAATGRQVRLERFLVRIATYRGGPCPAALVLRSRRDSSRPAAALKVAVEGKELAPWTIPAFPGDRRWVDVFYAIPMKALTREDGKSMKPEVAVSLSSEGPTLSCGYRMFMTRDWEVLGAEPQGPVARGEGGDAKAAYLAGAAALGERDYEAAAKAFEAAAADPAGELARLGRRMGRLVKLRRAMDACPVGRAEPGKPLSPEAFRAHYLLGLYASANGFWEEALEAFETALTHNSTHADATYRLAEAMEYNRMPVAACAPVFERAGSLYGRTDTNVEDLLVAINPRAVKDMCGELSPGSLEALYRDWRVVEQMVYGASRGAWRLRTTFRVWGPGTPDWVMQAGWIFLPPDSEVPVRGTYDYSVGTAEYGSSHAGGVDCGVSGSGGAQIGPTRSWEVFIHEWNHEYDWTCIAGEQVPGYPVTHDSDGCGKEPIVSMGCGHRSSMRYYVNPAEYRRHEASDPELPGNHVKAWAFAELAAPAPEGDLADWAVKQGWMTGRERDDLRRQWEAERKKDEAKTPDWPAWFQPRFKALKILDRVASPKEADLVADPGAVRWTRRDSKTEFVDLLEVFPKAPDKCVAYAQTFIYSPKKQEARLWLGYNDCMAVWLNGRKIHQGRYYACAKWEDANRTDMVANSAHLEEGWNRLVCKIERGGGGWGFSVGLTTFDNTPVAGLEYQNKTPSKCVPPWQPPKVGPYYKWDDVKEDWVERLPTLSEKDLRALTGLADLKAWERLFYLDVGGAAPAGARAVPAPVKEPTETPEPTDRQVNNFLQWDNEAVAAVRFQKGGKARDLLLIRPEYFDEYLELLAEKDAGLEGAGPKDRVVGTLRITDPVYGSTGNRFGSRYVLVVETFLGDYPLDEQDLLAVKVKDAK
jgi:hypothetical protein